MMGGFASVSIFFAMVIKNVKAHIIYLQGRPEKKIFKNCI